MTITNCFGKEHLILLVVPEEKNIGLQPYLILFLFLFFIFLAIGFIINDYSIFVIFYFLYVVFILIIAIPNFSLCIRRLHDVGKSGWFYLLCFIPIINLWPVALILFVDSEPHTNQWGEDPKKDERIKIH